MGRAEITYELLRKEKLDIYEALEINELANESQIRKAYRKQALRYHPDKNPTEEAKEKFQFISQIYDFLTNSKEEKEKYDNYLRQLRQQEARFAHADKSYQQKKRQLENLEREFAEAAQLEKQEKRVVESLQREGEQKRLELERQVLGIGKKEPRTLDKEDSYPQRRKLLIDDDLRTVIVGWASLSGRNAVLSPFNVERLMSVFGTVKSCSDLGTQRREEPDNNGHGSQLVCGQMLVTYSSVLSVAKALNVDLAKGCSYWDKKDFSGIVLSITGIDWKVDISNYNGAEADTKSASHYKSFRGDQLYSHIKENVFTTDRAAPLSAQKLLFEDYMEMTLLRLDHT